MSHVYKRVWYGVPIISIIGLLILFQYTNPASIGPSGILLVFILLYTCFVSVVFSILTIGLHIRRRHLRPNGLSTEIAVVSHRKAYYVASVVAFAPVCLMAMQSVGHLEIRDVLLVLSFVSIATFYVLRRS